MQKKKCCVTVRAQGYPLHTYTVVLGIKMGCEAVIPTHFYTQQSVSFPKPFAVPKNIIYACQVHLEWQDEAKVFV